MSKIKFIHEANIRNGNELIFINIDDYIEVSESMAVYFCNEDVEALSLKEQREHRRIKHSIRTPTEEQSNPHQDYTHL